MPERHERSRVPEPAVQPNEEQKVRLAINVLDIARIDPTIRQMMLISNLDVAGGAIRTDPKRLDEAAVAFSCSLVSAACIADVLRDHDRRAGDFPCRVYVKRKKAWVKLPHGAILTKVVNGKAVLNHQWFPLDVIDLPLAPFKLPERKRVV